MSGFSILKILVFSVWLIVFRVSASEKVVFASYTGKAPVIDGDISDSCWNEAEETTDFVLTADSCVRAPLRTTMRVLYDDGHLYLAVDCRTAGGTEISRAEPQGDKADHYTSLDSIEVFLDPLSSRSNYYQFVWSADGKRYDGFRMSARDFDGNWVFNTKVSSAGWTSEVAIPLDELRNGLPVAGTEWGFNMVRNDENNYSIWKYTGGAFHNPSLFGTLVIGDPGTWWRELYEERIEPDMEVLQKSVRAYPKNRYLAGQSGRMDMLKRQIAGMGAPDTDIRKDELIELYGYVNSLKNLLTETERYIEWSKRVPSGRYGR